ncbi:hypothetical protein BO94DRAFT_173629 [Aspergillus sclerotioniger CBS 115572]|uniref:Uncharacterized protein n=1 Tax=Aspergillus sclerotioniger CBS 115572 TaxID=1450535 RepID=A0A317W2N6_9EURO|nr:hypothetical protein BO94DRAFT_173629 [Aspergillus sclerotioniger CBS 115572]PWY79507.1 hypothetical protein BO94DRAFT_173629 [Aspergillus sclerotioniger CBS 115572]
MRSDSMKFFEEARRALLARKKVPHGEVADGDPLPVRLPSFPLSSRWARTICFSSFSVAFLYLRTQPASQHAPSWEVRVIGRHDRTIWMPDPSRSPAGLRERRGGTEKLVKLGWAFSAGLRLPVASQSSTRPSIASLALIGPGTKSRIPPSPER